MDQEDVRRLPCARRALTTGWDTGSSFTVGGTPCPHDLGLARMGVDGGYAVFRPIYRRPTHHSVPVDVVR